VLFQGIFIVVLASFIVVVLVYTSISMPSIRPETVVPFEPAAYHPIDSLPLTVGLKTPGTLPYPAEAFWHIAGLKDKPGWRLIVQDQTHRIRASGLLDTMNVSHHSIA